MPMDLEIIIPSDEPVRLLSTVTEELDCRRLTATCSRLGRIEYSPHLLFKIVLYGCSRGIYKTRELERACRENVNFMYLLEGHPAPDHNTIARFRREHLPYAAEDLLNQMVKPLVDCGEISLTFILFLENLCRKQPVKRVVADSGMVEWYLVSMAYNLLKLQHKAQTGRLGRHLVIPTVA